MSRVEPDMGVCITDVGPKPSRNTPPPKPAPRLPYVSHQPLTTSGYLSDVQAPSLLIS
jgi:hypothetical protein